METQQAIQAIRQFFEDKVQKSLLLEYKDIIKDAKKEGLKDEIDAIAKSYDATHHLLLKQQQLLKIQQHLQAQPLPIGDAKVDEFVHDLANILASLDHITKYDDVIKLKKDTDKLIKTWEKKLSKVSFDKAIKQLCQTTLATKYKADDMIKNSHIIERLKENNPTISQIIISKKQALAKKYEPNAWISECAKNAGNVNLKKTHISKLTHSSASSVNINAIDYQNSMVEAENQTTGYLSTHTIINPSYDFAYSSAGFASIADFLRTPAGHSTIGEAICEDTEVLLPFAIDTEQANEWQIAITQAFSEKKFVSHELLKQIYFPVPQDDYHLLCPLMSSSLVQAVDDRIWATRQKDMPARIARKNKTFSDIPDMSYPTTAKIQVTQSNHQNVSNLNGKRNGRLMLLNSAPPVINNKSKPFNLSYYFHGNSVFNTKLAYRMRVPLIKLRKMLYAIQTKELEQNLQRKKHIIKLVESLVYDVLMDIENIQDYLARQQDMSQDNEVFKLKPYEQYWLLHHHKDDAWLKAKDATDWEQAVAYAMADWINDSLRAQSKKLSLGTQHSKQWQKILTPLLRVSVAKAESYVTHTLINQEQEATA